MYNSFIFGLLFTLARQLNGQPWLISSQCFVKTSSRPSLVDLLPATASGRFSTAARWHKTVILLHLILDFHKTVSLAPSAS